MEGFKVNKVGKVDSCAILSIRKNTNGEAFAHKLFSDFDKGGVNILFIIKSVCNGVSNISFAIEKVDLEKSKAILTAYTDIDVKINDEISIISIKGMGLSHNTDVLVKIFEVLHDEQIEIRLISTGEIKILIAVDSKRGEEAHLAISKGLYGM